MEPISFAIGVASIASIFQTCIHAYRTLATAMTIGDATVTLDIQFQVEELRLRMWGKDWGLLKDEEQESEAKTISNDDSDSENSEEGKVTSKKRADFLDDIDDEFQIPGLQKVAIDVLGRISKSLEEWRSITEKYQAPAGAKVAGSVVDPAAGQSSRDALSHVSSKQAKQAKDISIRAKIIAKGRWALKDKQDLEDILAKLTRFNDGLQNLLPRRERASLNRGLAGELLKLLEDGTLVGSRSHVNEQLRHIEGTSESKAARIIGLKRMNKTEMGEKTVQSDGKDITADTATPFAKPSIWIEGSPGSMQIPFAQFHGLPEPKIAKMETHDDESRWILGKYVPLPRSKAIYFPAVHVSTTQNTRIDTAPKNLSTAEMPGQVTLVEWRPTAHESRASELTEQDLKDRRDHIARLLSRTATTDTEFRVLNCLGYTTTAGHTEDGSTHDLVGYVYQYPEFASSKSVPVSLRDLLGDAYNADNPKVPSLEVRFRLARSLSIALYQLQCAGWVHRKISSYNVIFFRDRSTNELNLDQPFLVGWQYSRPDDQRRIFPSERGNEGVGDLDMYVHRLRLTTGGHGRYPRFRKSFDIYSLGIILIEIAFWEPIIALTDEEERRMMELKDSTISSGFRAEEWWQSILKTAEEEIAPEMGAAYQEAVLFCLLGGQVASKVDSSRYNDPKEFLEGQGEKYYVDEEFEEIGIEKEFYWKVLKPLERFGI
ncbi:hypothetical protein IFR05_010308 [Cadophora sp. M221]|nr:hypothetical protein IFR05_010308 [Cadophora sp. M221]